MKDYLNKNNGQSEYVFLIPVRSCLPAAPRRRIGVAGIPQSGIISQDDDFLKLASLVKKINHGI